MGWFPYQFCQDNDRNEAIYADGLDCDSSISELGYKFVYGQPSHYKGHSTGNPQAYYHQTCTKNCDPKAKWEYNFATGNWSGYSGQIRNTNGEILACGTDPEYNSGCEVSGGSVQAETVPSTRFCNPSPYYVGAPASYCTTEETLRGNRIFQGSVVCDC